MKRTFASAVAAVAMAASLLAPALPALAQGSGAQADMAVSKARIEAYVKHVSNQEVFMTLDLEGQELVLPRGLVGYVDAWVGAFRAARAGNLYLGQYAVGYPLSTDANRRDGVDGFYESCLRYRDFLLKAQSTADRLIGASAGMADAALQLQVAAIVRTVANIAMSSMAVTVVTEGGNAAVHGNAVCAQAVADVYYSFNNPPAGSSFACAANLLSDPGRNPANANGICISRRRDALSISTMPSCTSGAGCNATVTTNCTDSLGCYWYDYALRKPKIDANLRKLEELLASEEARFTGLAGAIAKSEAEASVRAAEALKRGSVITLPLQLGSIEPSELIGRVIGAVLGVVGAITLLLFVSSGLSWMLAAGDAKKIDQAKKTIVWAVIGLVSIFAAYAVLNLVLQTFTT